MSLHSPLALPLSSYKLFWNGMSLGTIGARVYSAHSQADGPHSAIYGRVRTSARSSSDSGFVRWQSKMRSSVSNLPAPSV